MNDKSSGQPMWAYISLLTRVKHYLCPDPLCRHTEEDGCRYLGMMSLITDPDSESMLYTLKSITDENGFHMAICSIDLINDTINELYTVKNSFDSSESYFIQLRFINSGRLYFVENHSIRIDNGDGTVEKKDEALLAYLDLTTKKVTFLDGKYGARDAQAYINFVFADDNFIYFVDYAERRFYTTDHNFQNERTILAYEEGFSIHDIFYDQNDSCFYLGIFSDNMFGGENDDITRGDIYRIESGFVCEKIDMPSDQITSFRLTENYIYYTVYDPVIYGANPFGSITIDETGGKLYRVSRTDTKNSELIFDGKGEFFIMIYGGGYFVTGDYIYLDYSRLMKENGMVWFRRMGSTARINFKENTIAWLNVG
jgi:hypothetical protein